MSSGDLRVAPHAATGIVSIDIYRYLFQSILFMYSGFVFLAVFCFVTGSSSRSSIVVATRVTRSSSKNSEWLMVPYAQRPLCTRLEGAATVRAVREKRTKKRQSLAGSQ